MNYKMYNTKLIERLPNLIYLLAIDEITTPPNEPLPFNPWSSNTCFENFLLYIRYCTRTGNLDNE